MKTKLFYGFLALCALRTAPALGPEALRVSLGRGEPDGLRGARIAIVHPEIFPHLLPRPWQWHWEASIARWSSRGNRLGLYRNLHALALAPEISVRFPALALVETYLSCEHRRRVSFVRPPRS